MERENEDVPLKSFQGLQGSMLKRIYYKNSGKPSRSPRLYSKAFSSASK
jgi:hypothetical protein